MTDEETVLGAVQEAMNSLVGRFNINAGLMTVLQAKLEGLLQDHLKGVGASSEHQDWALLQLWFRSQDLRLEADGSLYSWEDVLIGRIRRDSVRRQVTVKVDEEDPTKIVYSLFEYDLVLEQPLNTITIDITLGGPERDLEENPYTAYEFRALHGRDPINDDLQRLNCPTVEGLGHWQCGLCPDHNKARFECGCLKEKE